MFLKLITVDLEHCKTSLCSFSYVYKKEQLNESRHGIYCRYIDFSNIELYN